MVWIFWVSFVWIPRFWLSSTQRDKRYDDDDHEARRGERETQKFWVRRRRIRLVRNLQDSSTTTEQIPLYEKEYGGWLASVTIGGGTSRNCLLRLMVRNVDKMTLVAVARNR